MSTGQPNTDSGQFLDDFVATGEGLDLPLHFQLGQDGVVFGDVVGHRLGPILDSSRENIGVARIREGHLAPSFKLKIHLLTHWTGAA